MISPSTAGLALSVANGLVKFGGRLDRLLAEKVAVRSGLELKLPAIDYSPGPNVVLPRLRAYLATTSDASPGPLGTQRRALAALLTPNYAYQPSDLGSLRRFYALAFPEEAVGAAVSPDDALLAYLRDAMPGARASLPENSDDKDKTKRANYEAALLASAFYTDAGTDQRQLGYPVRVGLLVVDVLSEFGAENTQLFFRDERLRAAAQAVLEKFAEPNLENYDAWSPLLRHALSATLNGVLDAGENLRGENPWFAAMLGALADARSAAGDAGDDYVLGLLRGRGYRPFVANALARAAAKLDEEQAPLWHQIGADLLTAAAPLVQNGSASFAQFFSDHWTDLMRAALASAEQHGSKVLEGQSPLAREVLTAAIKTLAQTPGANLLTSETVFALAHAALGAVATHPDLWPNNGAQWLQGVISSVVKTASDQGVQATFTKDGLATILRNAATTIAQHPEWLATHPGFVQEVVGRTLKRLETASTLAATTLATAAIQSALETIAARPSLLETKYPQVLADLAGLLAQRVDDRALRAIDASALVSAAAKAALWHVELFADQKGIAGLVISAVLRAAKDDPAQLLSGTLFADLAQQLFQVMARHGASIVDQAASDLEEKLARAIEAGLAVARQELGRTLDLLAVPAVVAEVVAAWARGEIATVAASNARFKKATAQIVARVAAARAIAS